MTPVAAEPPRDLALRSIANFRDYGGYAAAGGRLRRGRLYRSAQHAGASGADLERVGALDLRAVIDLRSGAERAFAPCPRPAGFAARVIAPEGDTTGLPPGSGGDPSLPAVLETAADARRLMLARYAAMPLRPHLLARLRLYLQALGGTEGATLVHCMAGKDRTGLAVALLHAAMGVSRDDATADYLLTNTAGDPASRLAAGAAALRQGWDGEVSDAVVAVLTGVEADYLRAAFNTIAAEAGGMAGYLRDRLGVDALLRARLDARLLA